MGKAHRSQQIRGHSPSLKKILKSGSFIDPNTASNRKTNEYFGGQNVNKTLSEAAQRPTQIFQYLPYNPYAQSMYGDYISKAYSRQMTLEKAMDSYARALAEHGTQEGYKVTVK